MSAAPRADDPYKDCAVYLEHGACVCSTGYPSSCTADSPSPCPSCGMTWFHKEGCADA